LFFGTKRKQLIDYITNVILFLFLGDKKIIFESVMAFLWSDV